MLCASSRPPFSTRSTASVCRSMTSIVLPANTLNALSRSPASPLCVMLNACACSACHGRPRSIELFARSVMVSTDLRRTADEGSWERECKRRRSRVSRVVLDSASYRASRVPWRLPGVNDWRLAWSWDAEGRNRSLRRRTSANERI